MNLFIYSLLLNIAKLPAFACIIEFVYFCVRNITVIITFTISFMIVYYEFSSVVIFLHVCIIVQEMMIFLKVEFWLMCDFVS